MKTTSTFGVHFKLRSDKMKDGKAPVHLGLVVNGEKSYISLKNYQVEVKLEKTEQTDHIFRSKLTTFPG